MAIKIKTDKNGKQIVKGTCTGCGKNVTGMLLSQYNKHMERCAIG